MSRNNAWVPEKLHTPAGSPCGLPDAISKEDKYELQRAHGWIRLLEEVESMASQSPLDRSLLEIYDLCKTALGNPLEISAQMIV